MTKATKKYGDKIVIPVGSDTLVVGRTAIWVAILGVMLMFVAAVVSAVASLQLVARYTQQNSVHRARNEASHICIAETFGEARHLAKRNMDWSPKDSLAFYEECADRVAATLITPDTATERLRFAHPTPIPFAPTPSRKRTARSEPSPASTRYGKAIYVPPPETAAPSSPAPTPSRETSTPEPTHRPTPRPTACDPACLPMA